MSTDWIPFGKPIQYRIKRTVYHELNGWIIAWRPNWCDDKASYCDAIQYLTSDCSIIVINEGEWGEELEFIP